MKVTCCVSCNMNKILYFLLRAKGRTSRLECPTNIFSCTLTGMSWPEHNLDIWCRGTSSRALTDVENVCIIGKLYLIYLMKIHIFSILPEGEQDQEVQDKFRTLENYYNPAKDVKKSNLHPIFDILLPCLSGLLGAVRRVQLRVRMQEEGVMNVSGHK